MIAEISAARWRLVVAIVLLSVSGCAWAADQKPENLRADTILKQSIEDSKQR
jgi:hypothetical protein